MAVLIISITSLIVSVFALYRFTSFEAESIAVDCENLDTYDDLEKRIEALEYGVGAYAKNIEILAGQITKLQVETIELKNSLSNLNTSVNNLTPFIDKTRGMAEENTKRIDDITK